MTTTPVGHPAIPSQRAMTLSDQVADEIMAMLGRKRWSQARLARELNRPKMWVSDRVNGKQPINLNDLQQIAEVLGVSIIDLLPAAGNLNTVRYDGLAPESAGTPRKMDISGGSRRRPKLLRRVLATIPTIPGQRVPAGVTI